MATSTTHEGIDATNSAFMNAFNNGDAASVAALYTDDAQFLAPNTGPIAGQDAIASTFQSFMDAGIKSIKLETLEVEEYGDTASEVGRYTLLDADGNVADQGKFLVIWKQEGGTWKLHRDMINTSQPA